MRLLHLVVLFGRSAARIQVNVFVWASKLSVHPLRRKNSNKNVYENGPLNLSGLEVQIATAPPSGLIFTIQVFYYLSE